ncbi:MAG: hypothetical protein K9M75_07165 [Phycisphaerae bacterium]|nr:hypothetical protein [Phycisphaerae bacterium]
MEVTAKGILYKIANRFDLKRDTIEDRLKLQKTIYLLEEYGLNLGYGFGWYKYGPYSSDLVQDAYSVLYAENERYRTETANWEFSADSENKFKEFGSKLKGVLGNAEKLELVASVNFVCNRWKPGVTKRNVASEFKQFKEVYFNKAPIQDGDIEEAFDISQELLGVA